MSQRVIASLSAVAVAVAIVSWGAVPANRTSRACGTSAPSPRCNDQKTWPTRRS